MNRISLVIGLFIALVTEVAWGDRGVAKACDPRRDIHCHGYHHHRSAISPAAPQPAVPLPAAPLPAARPIAAPSAPILPVREYLKAADIPPSGVGAYGIVAFKSKATSVTRSKQLMICASFVAHFPPNASIPGSWPLSDRMVTVWPLDDPTASKVAADDCEYVVDHYDLFAGEAAIADAERQHANLRGEGPFLIGWSPSNSRGAPDALVLIVDMSTDDTQERIDREFTFWKDKIVEDPSLWRSGFTERVRFVIHDFADQYGSSFLDAIKLVGLK